MVLCFRSGYWVVREDDTNTDHEVKDTDNEVKDCSVRA